MPTVRSLHVQKPCTASAYMVLRPRKRERMVHLMSYRFFQSVVVQMKSATDRSIGVIDSDGLIVASSELSLIGTHMNRPDGFVSDAENDTFVFEDRTFRKITSRDSRSEYDIYVTGTDDMAHSLCIMASVAVSEAMLRYEEKYDKSTLVKNIITDNILPSDIYAHARELDFSESTSRGVFLIRRVDRGEGLVEAVQAVFPDRHRDFVLFMSETDVVVIKEVPASAEAKDLQKIALTIENALSPQMKTVIGIGAPARYLRELADRYKETLMAIEIGSVFEPEKTIINYESLGLGRLIYQLPTTLCEMFLSEVFKKNPIDSLDEETLAIIDRFFENNLNISETSRKLFVHRNTLVYRLGKIKKLTGLDLREFDQAIVFKVALMVKKYLDSKKA